MRSFDVKRFCLGVIEQDDIVGVDASALPKEIRRYFAKKFSDKDGKVLFLSDFGEPQFCDLDILSAEEKKYFGV